MSADGSPLSVPPRRRIPRPLTETEGGTLRRIADTLVPARGDIPAAGAEPGFADSLALALEARSDAFEPICAALAALAPRRSRTYLRACATSALRSRRRSRR